MAAVKSKEVDGVLIVGFSAGQLLDESVIQQTGKELLEKVAEAEASKKLLLTFHGVTFMSSAMLGRLVMLQKSCKQKGVDLKVCSISPEIFEVFKITKLNKMFDVHKDEQKALDSFNQKGWFG